MALGDWVGDVGCRGEGFNFFNGSNLLVPWVFSPEVYGFGSLRYMQLQRESQFNRQGLALKGVGFEIRGRREVGVCTSLTS